MFMGAGMALRPGEGGGLVGWACCVARTAALGILGVEIGWGSLAVWNARSCSSAAEAARHVHVRDAGMRISWQWQLQVNEVSLSSVVDLIGSAVRNAPSASRHCYMHRGIAACAVMLFENY